MTHEPRHRAGTPNNERQTTMSTNAPTVFTADKARIGGAVSALLAALCTALFAYFNGRNEMNVEGIIAAIGVGLATGLPTAFAVYVKPNVPTTPAA